MTRTTRLIAAVCASAMLSLAGAVTAPTAQAADFFGTGDARCSAALATRGTELGFVTDMDGRRSYEAGIDLGTTVTSAARLRAPRTTVRSADGAASASWAGYLALDGRGSAWFVRQAEDGTLISRTKIRGPWRGLRTLVAAAATGAPDSPTTAARQVYGVTAAGVLVRMPVSWNAAGIPGVGTAQVLGRGFGGYSGLRFAAYAHDADHAPVADHLVGVTTSGRFNRVEITRGSRPTVRVSTLARSGFGSISDLVHDQCWQDGKGEAWIVRYRNGSLAHYLDPDITDSSLRGLKRTPLSGRLPTGIRLV